MFTLPQIGRSRHSHPTLLAISHGPSPRIYVADDARDACYAHEVGPCRDDAGKLVVANEEHGQLQ